MAKSVHLSNGRQWKTQTAAIGHFRAMLHRYGNGDTISDPSDHDDLASLLERYDEAVADVVSKIGSGIDHFERRLNFAEGRTTPGFWAVRTDGSATDFSFYAGVRGQPKQEAHEFSDACRAAVAGELKRAKRDHFTKHADVDGRVPCDLTDTLVTHDEAHVDHAFPSFGQIAAAFRAAKGWHAEIPTGVLTPSRDQQTITTFVDPATVAEFREFHRRLAKLRVVAAERNLAMAARQRVPKVKRPVEI